MPKQTNQAGSSRVLLPEKGTNAGRVPGVERTQSDPHWAPHNQNITHDERLAIDPGRKFTAASMLRLTGPAIDATAGVTLGGASVDEFERWAPPMNEEVRLTGREILVDVPAASAALVSLRG